MAHDGILIVDDDPGAIQLLRRMLGRFSQIRYATNGVDALRIARETVPDLVLLDAEMPGMSGFDVCRELKADPVLRDTPVLFVTGHDDLAFETRALTLGAADFITKPLNPVRVNLRVDLHLKLKQHTDLLRKLATTDGLTGLANRRVLDETLALEWRIAVRTGRPLSVLMVDVDYFKNFNDAYGHPAGDACLQSVARALDAVPRRPGDLVGRYGGEEFAVLLPDTSEEGARLLACALCTAVAEVEIPHCGSAVSPHVTVSVGGASRVPGDPSTEPDGLVQAADRALYLAKQLGRDRTAFMALQ